MHMYLQRILLLIPWTPIEIPTSRGETLNRRHDGIDILKQWLLEFVQNKPFQGEPNRLSNKEFYQSTRFDFMWIRGDVDMEFFNVALFVH